MAEAPVPQRALLPWVQDHREELRAAIDGVLDNGSYILGDEVRRFEVELAAWIGAGHGIGVANGTEAITLALRASGVTPGSAVVTASHTAVATVAAIELAGCRPVLADVDPKTFTLDPDSFEAAVARSGASAAVVVHLYGHMADLDRLLPIAAAQGVTVIEDCAQAHGSKAQGRTAGTVGSAASFSFYPTKNLGAIGDAGAVVTDNAATADRVRDLRQYGWRERFISAEPGFNSRLDELQAAILRVGLRYLTAANQRRAAIAAAYTDALIDGPVLVPVVREGFVHSWHQYVVRTPQRTSLQAHLQDRGIGWSVHYPAPVHRQPAYVDAERTDMAATDRLAVEILSLPMYPELTDDQVARVIDAMTTWAP